MAKPEGATVESSSYRPRFFALLAISFAGAILGDSVAESLILSHFNASIIPQLYLVNAGLLFFFSFFLMSIVDRVDRGSFFMAFTAAHALLLAGVWLAVSSGATWLFIPLFCYSYITKIFLFMLFWTLVNDVVDTRRAGRDFPFIAAGGTLGAISVSFSIPWLIHAVPARTLLLGWSMVMLAVLALFSLSVRTRYGRLFKPASDRDRHRNKHGFTAVRDDLAIVLHEPLLVNMSILYFLLFFVLLNQHYLFYSHIRERFNSAESLASFLGFFNGISMGATFLLQISLAGIIIRKVGSTRAMFMLPVAFCLVFAVLALAAFQGLAAASLFWIIVAGVGIRIAFFDSFFSPNFQVFFSSIPQEFRGRGKLGMEGVVKPVAMISASLWMVFAAPHLSLAMNAAILLLCSLAMIAQTFRIRGKYTLSLSQYLADFKSRMPSSLIDASAAYDNEQSLAHISAQLTDDSFEIRAYTIEILADIGSEDAVAQLVNSLSNADGRTRAAVVAALGRMRRPALKHMFMEIFRSDSDERVVANAVFALAAYNETEINGLLYGCIRHRNNRVRANTIIALWPLAGFDMRARFVDIMQEMTDPSASASECVSALYAMREIGSDRPVAELFESFARNQMNRIVDDRRIWIHFLRVIGRNPNRDMIELILEVSVRLGAKRRSDVVAALVEAIGSGYDPSALFLYLEPECRRYRPVIIRALSDGGYVARDRREEALILHTADEEHKEVYRHWYGYHALVTYGRRTPGLDLLAQAIREECIQGHLATLCAIAALLDKSGVIRGVVKRLSHDNRHVRARAMEVLDNVGNIKVNRWIIELIDSERSLHHFENAKSLYRFADDVHDIPGIMKRYIHHANSWVADCAAYAYNLSKIGR